MAHGGVDEQVEAAPRLAPVAENEQERHDDIPDQEGPEGVGAGSAVGGAEPASAGAGGPPSGEAAGGAKRASAGDGGPLSEDEGEEEARRPEKVRDPCAPTKAQWDEHQATHLPFRI